MHVRMMFVMATVVKALADSRIPLTIPASTYDPPGSNPHDRRQDAY